jgi:hypothetical protein
MTAAQDVPDEAAGRELRRLLDRELSRLPDKYRAAVVLCDLEGKTRKEAARLLGWPEGTLSTRLLRARRLLAGRLSGPGLALTGAAVAAVFSQGAARAGVPAPLLASTIKAATAVAAGQAVVGVVSAPVAALTEGVLKVMFITRLRVVTTVLVVALSLAAAAGVLAPLALCQKADGARGAEPRKEDKAEPKAAAKGAGVRKVLEAVDWTVTDVDADKGTLSVDDHATYVQTGNPKLAVIATPNGLAASGLALLNLPVARDAKITLDGKEAKLKDLAAGMHAFLRTEGDDAVITRVVATSPRPGVFRYVLKAVDAKAGTITATLAEKNLDLESVPVAKDAQVRFFEAPGGGAALRDAKLEDLQPGMHLALELAADKDGKIAVKSILATK